MLIRVGIAIGLCFFLTWPMARIAAADPTFGSEPVGGQQPESYLWLNRPFAEEEEHPIEHTFLYGSLGVGRCGLHTGLDLRSAMGEPVTAVASGQVVYAGEDSTQLLGPRLNYYGKTVLLKLEQGDCVHTAVVGDLPDYRKLAVYVLYAHLGRISVQVGQFVRAGDVLGSVGMTGIAMGPHLHLEVRVGNTHLTATRNPSLWLRPLSGHGVIAGKLLDTTGNFIVDDRVLVYRVEGQKRLWRVVRTYPADPLINADSVLEENFALTDVPPGEYELVAGQGAKLVRLSLTVNPDRMSFVELMVPK